MKKISGKDNEYNFVKYLKFQYAAGSTNRKDVQRLCVGE